MYRTALIFLLVSIDVFGAKRSYCPQSEGANIVGSFFSENRKNETTPDYCEYHVFDENIFPAKSLEINSGSEFVALSKSATYNVIYKKFNGKQFARKQVDFSEGLKTPLVEQLDIRKGEVRRVRLDDKNDQLWNVFYQKTSGSKEKKTVLKKVDVDVNDAGFVREVRSRWDDLLSGETVKFNFLSIPHGRTIKMSAKKYNNDKCDNGIKTQSDDSLVCIKVGISNVIFRILAPALWLSFDSESQQLDVFKGIVNIRDEKGKNQVGSIYYEYF